MQPYDKQRLTKRLIRAIIEEHGYDLNEDSIDAIYKNALDESGSRTTYDDMLHAVQLAAGI